MARQRTTSLGKIRVVMASLLVQNLQKNYWIELANTIKRATMNDKKANWLGSFIILPFLCVGCRNPAPTPTDDTPLPPSGIEDGSEPIQEVGEAEQATRVSLPVPLPDILPTQTGEGISVIVTAPAPVIEPTQETISIEPSLLPCEGGSGAKPCLGQIKNLPEGDSVCKLAARSYGVQAYDEWLPRCLAVCEANQTFLDKQFDAYVPINQQGKWGNNACRFVLPGNELVIPSYP